MQALEKLFNLLAGRALHALWLGLCAYAALISPPPLSAAAMIGFVLAALPGVLGLFLAGERLARSDAARLVLALSWTLPGIAAAISFSTAISPAALIFLAGPATMAAAAGAAQARVAAVLSALAFILTVLAGVPGPLSTSLSDVLGRPEIWAAFAGYLGLAGLIGRTRLERRLAKLERRLKDTTPAAEAFAEAPAPMLALDKSGAIKAASSATRRVVPGAPHSLTGLKVDELGFDEEAQAQVRRGLHSAREGGSADGGGFTFTVRDRDGGAVKVDARAVSTPEGFVLSFDRSGSAEIAPAGADDRAHLIAERDAALAANRSKSEFLAAVSHELRTPLNAIIGFSDVMKQRLFGPLPARYAEYGDLIHESGAHLLELIGDVLDMSKIEADRYELSVETFDARDVVEICSKMLRLRAEEKGVALFTDTGDAPLMVEADRKALRQILLNLLSNAVKFTPEGGAVVSMARAQDGALVLAVGDSGVGIDPEELDQIGQAWNQTRSARETTERGAGLGLSLVRALAELHGGEMSVQSAPGEGTTITVSLPVLVSAELSDTGPAAELEVHQRIRAAQTLGDELQTSA